MTNRSALARAAALLHLLGLGSVITMGWHEPGATGMAALAGLPSLHLAFLFTTGAAAALLTLGARQPRGTTEAAQQERAAAAGADHLLAQMSHELRTPLNAMIGFSEVMLRELYGPLGHARYQEYAAHISQSSGQLLRSSEDALAVTETMSAVMADRLAGRRERIIAGGLVRDAWTASDQGRGSIKLAVSNCTACDIVCERRATGQALQHLLRVAAAKVPAGGGLEVKGRRRGNARSLEIRVVGADEPDLTEPSRMQPDGHPYAQPGNNLRVMLARMLLEMQGATLSLWDEEDAGLWSACIAFAPEG